MVSLKLDYSYVNSYREFLPNVMSKKEGKAIQEMLSWYFPNGPIQFSTNYNGGAGISQAVVANSEHWNTDQVMSQILGLPSLNFDLKSSVIAGGKGFRLASSFLSGLGESVESLLSSKRT